MPTLTWTGKEKVINHHQAVPLRVLEHRYGFTAENGRQPSETNSGNMIIHGDNLEGLKSLLPKYEGKIKCIYIDPPYNTGNEKWVYNDNVNDPKFKKWLGQVVGKESEDLNRHDKWLCMIYPRLKLLHKLLADDGAIFISIDDNEQANLKLICDEVFGVGNFINNVIWEKNYSPRNDAKYFSASHEFIIVYANNKKQWNRNLLSRTESQNKKYKYNDNDGKGLWRSDNLLVKSFSKSGVFPIVNPHTNKEYYPPQGNCWRTNEENMKGWLAENRVYFGKDNKGAPQLKRYFNEVQQGTVPITLWKREEVGDSQAGKKEVQNIFFNGGRAFETPKPLSLIERILQITTDKDSIILDSFAGSGTTAHAVLNLNKQDGGNRKFILIEMEDYAENITSERVKRVINGYGTDKNFVEGLGGSFDYYELGKPLFVGENQEFLNEEVEISKIREYVFYSETKASIAPEMSSYNPSDENRYYLGQYNGTAYYFIYEKDQTTTLNYNILPIIKDKAEQYIIYADNCLLSDDFMKQYNITFKKIPRDITRL